MRAGMRVVEWYIKEYAEESMDRSEEENGENNAGSTQNQRQ